MSNFEFEVESVSATYYFRIYLTMDQIILFEKNCKVRLVEYLHVLDTSEILPISKLKTALSSYLEFVIESKGWHAVWNIPRKVCESFEILFPTTVLIKVNSVNFYKLTAEVQVIAVHGDIEMPEFNIANLQKLWPIIQQPNGMDIKDTANALDMLRFYCNNILMPWDIDEHVNKHYISGSNLEERLTLFYDIKKGILPKKITHKYSTLLKEIQDSVENMGDEFSFFSNLMLDESSNDYLIDLHCKILDLKTEATVLQLIKSRSEKKSEITKKLLLFPPAQKISNYSDYLKSVKYLDDGSTYKSSCTLQQSLYDANKSDTIILSPGEHIISCPGVLEDGAIIKNPLEDADQVIIISQNENSVLEFFGEQLNFENVTIRIPRPSCGIIGHCGIILLKNCKIIGNKTDKQIGLIALAKSKLILENCSISGFNVGIYMHTYGTVSIQNCVISDVLTGIKMSDKSTVTISDTKFINCSNACIHVETNTKIENGVQMGDTSLMKE